jgi:hypothetical protein
MVAYQNADQSAAWPEMSVPVAEAEPAPKVDSGDSRLAQMSAVVLLLLLFGMGYALNHPPTKDPLPTMGLSTVALTNPTVAKSERRDLVGTEPRSIIPDSPPPSELVAAQDPPPPPLADVSPNEHQEKTENPAKDVAREIKITARMARRRRAHFVARTVRAWCEDPRVWVRPTPVCYIPTARCPELADWLARTSLHAERLQQVQHRAERKGCSPSSAIPCASWTVAFEASCAVCGATELLLLPACVGCTNILYNVAASCGTCILDILG